MTDDADRSSRGEEADVVAAIRAGVYALPDGEALTVEGVGHDLTPALAPILEHFFARSPAVPR